MMPAWFPSEGGMSAPNPANFLETPESGKFSVCVESVGVAGVGVVGGV
jgi:hypothetical protein